MEVTYIGDTPRLRMTLNEDITTATATQFRLLSPSGTITVVTATVETAATGIIYYDCATTVLNEVGQWTIQALCTFTAKIYSSRIRIFKVLAVCT